MEQNEIQFILYNMPGEDGKVQVVIKDETIWATQKAIVCHRHAPPNSVNGQPKILKSDVTIAKNYLPEKQIHQLERAVSSYFDYFVIFF